MPAACSQAPGAYSGLEEDSKGKINAELTKANRLRNDDDDAYEDDENVKNKTQTQQPKRKQRKCERIAAQAREEAKAAKAAEKPVFYLHVPANMPERIDEGLPREKTVEYKAQRFVDKHEPRFNPHVRGTVRAGVVTTSKYNLVYQTTDRLTQTVWDVKLDQKMVGRCATEEKAGWLAHKVLEKGGFPTECLNFNPKGDYCYSKEAHLALFTPFTSDIPGIYQESNTGKFRGVVSMNGKQHFTRKGADETEVGPLLAALKATT
jgi:hypothetical protein